MILFDKFVKYDLNKSFFWINSKQFLMRVHHTGLYPSDRSDKLRKSSCCQQLPIFSRSISGHFLEHPIEMLGILKAQFIGNLVYGLLRIGKQVLGRIYDFALDVFLRILSRFLFNQVSEIVGRKEYLISKIPYGLSRG